MLRKYLPVSALAVVLAQPAVASAADIYVTPNTGAPNGNGSLSSPYNSVAAGLNAANPGDVVRLLPGTYNTPVQFPRAGTPGNPITLTSHAGPRTAIIDCQWAIANCITADRSYVTIDGLEVRNARYNGIKADGDVRGSADGREYGSYGAYGERRYYVNGADGIVIRNNYVHHICLDGLKIGHVNNILIENNEVYKTGMTDPISGSPNQQQGIDLVGVYNAIIRGNYIHDDQGASSMEIGLFAKGGSETILIENNRVENIVAPNAAIEIGGDTENYNTRYTPSQVNAQFHADMLSQNGAPLETSGRYVAATMSEARRVTVRGNVIANADPALSFRNTADSVAYNNTVINCGGSQAWVKLWNDGGNLHVNTNVRLYNNLYLNTTVALRPATGGGGQRYNDRNGGANMAGFVTDYNVFYNQGNPTVPSSEVATTNPDGNSDTMNVPLDATFAPAAGSPVLTTGINLRTIGVLGANESWTDRNGRVRGGDTVVGALAGAPAGGGTPPAAPTNVRITSS